MRRTTPLPWLAIVFAAALPGCGGGPTATDSSYGRVYGKSLNGTSVLADMVRDRDHTVRVAVRLNRDLAANADVLVRFAPRDRPPDPREARWYSRWLGEDRSRRLLYVVRDYDATPDYWAEVIRNLPKDHPDRARASKLLERAKAQKPTTPPTPDASPGPSPSWFGTGPAVPAPDFSLWGAWAEGIDAEAAALPVHDRLVPPRVGRWEVPLLEGENELVLQGRQSNPSGEMMVVANGSFLLNGALLNRARRPLASRTVDWLAGGGRRVVFVEGTNLPIDSEGRNDNDPAPRDAPPADDDSSASGLAIGMGGPLDLIALQFLGLGVLASLYRGTRLGRPRGEPPPGVGKPSAHAEALGDLLARTRRPDAARSLVEAYRRWRAPDRPPSS